MDPKQEKTNFPHKPCHCGTGGVARKQRLRNPKIGKPGIADEQWAKSAWVAGARAKTKWSPGERRGTTTRVSNFLTFQKSVSLTGTSQRRVFSCPVNSPALHPFNETLLPWQLKIGQSIKTRTKDKCQGPFKLVLLYFYGCWEQKTLMRIEDLLQDRCWPQGSDSDTPWRWWWPDLVCGPRQFVIQLHSPSSALRTMRLLSFWS